jgi:hypothetical protein
MPNRRILLLLLVGAAVFLRFRSENGAPETGNPISEASGARGKNGEPTSAKDVPLIGKVREREPEKEHDLDETNAALNTTLPGLTEFPEQTLQERILATNALLKKAGIRLRFGVDEVLYPSQNLLEMKVPAFSQENATPNDILQHSVKAMNKHYMYTDGAVLFQDGSGG